MVSCSSGQCTPVQRTPIYVMILVLAAIEAVLDLLNQLRANFCLCIGQAVGPMKTPCHESDPRYSKPPSNKANDVLKLLTYTSLL